MMSPTALKPAFRKLRAQPLLLFMVTVGVAVYLRLFSLPNVPIISSEGDQWIFLTDAWRMLRGETIYKDFFQFTAPGAQVIYLALLKLLGVRAWIPNGMLLVVGLTFTWLVVMISRMLLAGPAAYLPGVLFVALSLFGAPDATHHWYSALAVTAATALAMERRSLPRLAGAGLLCGLAAFFTQTTGVGAAIGLSAFLVWECLRRSQSWRSLLTAEACLLTAFLAAFVGLNAYFIWRAGLERFLACTVVFVVKYYAASPANNLLVYARYWGELPFWQNLVMWGQWSLVHALLPLVFLLFFVRYAREKGNRPDEPWDRLMLANIMGLSLFVSVTPAPSFFRLRVVPFPLALILLAWFVRYRQKFFSALRACLWFGAVVLIVGKSFGYQLKSTHFLDIPSGRVCLHRADSYEELQWLARKTHPGEYIFDFGWEPMLYPLLQLKNPAKVPFLDATDYTRPEQVREVIEALERYRVQYVLCPARFDKEQIEFSLPPSVNHLGPFFAYLHAHYHVIHSFDDSDQVWERNVEPAASEGRSHYPDNSVADRTLASALPMTCD